MAGLVHNLYISPCIYHNASHPYIQNMYNNGLDSDGWFGVYHMLIIVIIRNLNIYLTKHQIIIFCSRSLITLTMIEGSKRSKKSESKDPAVKLTAATQVTWIKAYAVILVIVSYVCYTFHGQYHSMQYFIWDGKTKAKNWLIDINIQVTIEIFQEGSLFHKQ